MKDCKMTTLELAIGGDSDAAAQVIESVAKRVRYLCSKANYKITAVRADADDASQMALVRIYQALVSGDCAGMDKDAFGWFVFRQARNACRLIENTHGRKKREIAKESTSLNDADADAGYSVAVSDRPVDEVAAESELIDALLGMVSRDDDKFILNSILGGLTINEIAASLKVTPAFVYTRISKLRVKARAQLVS